MKNGFTLIELMIVTSISLILGSSILVNYNSYIENQQIVQAGQTLQANFDFARTKAITGDRSSFDECITFNGYRITWNDPYSYETYIDCDPADILLSETYTPGRVAVGNFGSILFQPLTEGTDLAAERNILIALGQTAKFQLTVYPNGTVTESTVSVSVTAAPERVLPTPISPSEPTPTLQIVLPTFEEEDPGFKTDPIGSEVE